MYANMYQILTTVRMLLIFWKFVVCSEAMAIPDSNEVYPIFQEKVERAANKTVCPFFVHVNRNESRWPVEYKEIKCISPMKENCCGHEHECTQLFDTVEFYSSDRKERWNQLVDVGCVCMKTESGSVSLPQKPSIT